VPPSSRWRTSLLVFFSPPHSAGSWKKPVPFLERRLEELRVSRSQSIGAGRPAASARSFFPLSFPSFFSKKERAPASPPLSDRVSFLLFFPSCLRKRSFPRSRSGRGAASSLFLFFFQEARGDRSAHFFSLMPAGVCPLP